MTSTEASFSFTTKINGDLLTVRGDDYPTFKRNLSDAVLGLDGILEDIAALQAAGHAIPAVNVVAPAAPQQGPAPTTTIPAWPTPQPGPPQPMGFQGGVEVVQDRYGNSWTYNHPDAPDLPDGRGKYAQKQGVSKDNKAYTGWFDPAKGPKPFAKGAVEAPAIWPKRG